MDLEGSQPASGAPRPTIVVVGPGAMGLLFAARLALSGAAVRLLDYRPDRAARLDERGVVLRDAAGDRPARIPTSADPHILARADLALVLVKSYHTEAAAAALAAHLSPRAAAATLQNGLGNVEILSAHLGQDRIFGGTTAQGALLEEPGVVRDTGSGPTALGRPDATSDPRLDDLCSALLAAGFSISITTDLRAALWQKAVLNAAINPVAALTRLRNGELAGHEGSLAVMTAAAREAFGVARAHGIFLEEQDWRARLQTVCQATAPNVNSMLQDVLQGRRTEIDAINGAIVRAAEQHATAVPVNRSLWYLVKTIEEAYGSQAAK